MSLGASLFITWLYGDNYAGAGVVLSIHIWAGLFVAMGAASGRWLINEGLTKLSMIRTVLGSVANVVLNLLLIPKYGPSGAAIATIVSQAIAAIVYHGVIPITRPLFVIQFRALLLHGLV